MNLEEWLKSEVEYAKNAMIGNYDTEELNHYEGYKEAMEAVLEQLPKLDHDVTLKEVKEMCLKGCYGCPLAIVDYNAADGSPYQIGCEMGSPLCWPPVDNIQKCMKEARK